MSALKRIGPSGATAESAKRPRRDEIVYGTRQTSIKIDLSTRCLMFSESEWRRNRDRLEELVAQYSGMRLLVEAIRKHYPDLHLDFDLHIVAKQLLRSNMTVFDPCRHILWTQMKTSLARIKTWRRLGGWNRSRLTSGPMPFFPLYEKLQAIKFLDITDNLFPSDFILRLAEVDGWEPRKLKVLRKERVA